jgi:hypothetical protein
MTSSSVTGSLLDRKEAPPASHRSQGGRAASSDSPSRTDLRPER